MMRKVACDLMGSKSSERPRPCRSNSWIRPGDSPAGCGSSRGSVAFFVGNLFFMILVKGVTPKENDMTCIVIVCLCVLLLL